MSRRISPARVTAGRRRCWNTVSCGLTRRNAGASAAARKSCSTKRREHHRGSWCGARYSAPRCGEAEARQAEINAQLRHAQKIDALGTLAGGIAHDLNNTLVPIRTLAPILKRGMGRSEQEQRSLDLIMGAAQRASRLVRQILAFSRKQTVERQPVRLDELVKDSLTMLRAGIPPHVRIDMDIVAVPEILGNQGQLYQVVLNLVLNAAQAIGDRPGTISITVAPEGGGARLCVTETGSGMDEETQRRIFEPFFTTKAASEGTGLGLSVVNGIITEHGGKIAVASKPTNGTRFEAIFPRLQIPIPGKTGMTARIEIIDDDAAVRESLTLMLEAGGYEVKSADAGDSGLALARDFHPDVILTDIIMPGCEGIETILRLKSEHPRIKIIAMSGGGRVGNKDYLELAQEMGADAALEKPFDEEALLQAIRMYS